MKNLITVIIGIAILMSSCTQVVDIAVEEAKVNTVIDQSTEVVKAEDMDLFSKVFAQDADMIVFGTDSPERAVGYEALKELVQKQFEETESTKISAKDRIIKVHDSGRVAWFSEVIDWEIEAEGQTVKLEGVRGTGILENRNGNWVIVQLHYSLPAGG
ncbi:nuclear transport factor 2 family protein [candidate division KSB1 bacterium]|nr:nuclear transport factor 2 family protein [candidate division KSB1 bacterium]